MSSLSFFEGQEWFIEKDYDRYPIVSVMMALLRNPNLTSIYQICESAMGFRTSYGNGREDYGHTLSLIYDLVKHNMIVTDCKLNVQLSPQLDPDPVLSAKIQQQKEELGRRYPHF